MFCRKITETLTEWIRRGDRKPLLLRGARQVGKTTTVRMFADRLPGFMELNLEAPGEKDVFERKLSPVDLVAAIRLAKGVTAPLEKSLLFLDEIQASPAAVGSLRHLYEKVPELPVIASGSLLETTVPGGVVQFPVGRVEHAFMYPAIFREYLLAQGRSDMIDLLDTVPLPDYAVPQIYAEYVRYAIAGGMPEIVAAMASGTASGDLTGKYASLMVSFMDDVPKYASNRTMAEVLRHCIASIPLETGSRIRFAGFGASSYRSREVAEAMRTLERAMLIHLAYPTSEVAPPPRPDHRKSPKLLFLDSGLLSYSLGIQADLLGTEDLNAHARGAFAEQCAGQALMSLGTETPPSVGFWARDHRGSSAEVDYLLLHAGRLVPVEVKSGASGRLRSLHAFMDRCEHDMAVRLYGGPIHVDRVTTPSRKRYRLLNLPHYLVGELPRYLDWFATEGREA